MGDPEATSLGSEGCHRVCTEGGSGRRGEYIVRKRQGTTACLVTTEWRDDLQSIIFTRSMEDLPKDQGKKVQVQGRDYKLHLPLSNCSVSVKDQEVTAKRRECYHHGSSVARLLRYGY